MNKLSNHTALKEWANVIEALSDGRQILLIRKGGIADPKFGIEADRFYLYPTFFHQGEQDPRTEVELTTWCEVVRVWTIRDLELLGQLEPYVAIPRETLLARYRFRPDQALHVIGVRAWRLASPRRVMFREPYAGCISWISVDEEIAIDGSTSVLAEDLLTQRLDAIDALIGAHASSIGAGSR
jgi:hypothetical protein